jgi:hypothetical protein
VAIPGFIDDWSPGKGRNEGVSTAKELDPDLSAVCFIDADTITPHEQIEQALDWAEADPGLVYGYTIYQRLDDQGRVTRELTFNGSMGCAAISLKCFDKVGGFDESFIGWGYEDLDFAQRCACYWPLRRVDGIATHLWHGFRNPDDSPSDSLPDEVAANRQRYQANSILNYQAVSGGREPVT